MEAIDLLGVDYIINTNDPPHATTLQYAHDGMLIVVDGVAYRGSKRAMLSSSVNHLCMGCDMFKSGKCRISKVRPFMCKSYLDQWLVNFREIKDGST